MRGELGDDYTEALRNVYDGRVPGGADLVTYWFEKARAQIEAGKCRRAGLVATNSIRGGANQQVLARIINAAVIPAQSLPPRRRGAGIQPIEKLDSRFRGNDEVLRIFNAWSDEEWINEGAAVRVSLVCFGETQIPPIPPFTKGGTEGGAQESSPFAKGGVRGIYLNGQPVAAIHADLTAGEGLNLTQARPLKENAGACFMGASKKAPFDIPGELARQWLKLPNPNGRPNSDVVRPWANGMDITRRASDTWIIDFGTTMSEADAALYETPFEYVVQYVKPEREQNNREAYRKYWWRHAEARPGMRAALEGLPRYIATPHVSKHRIFVWVDTAVLPDQMLIVTARSDDTTFGILHSRFHELWALRMGTWMGVGNDPRYTPTTTFETFPFPEGLTPKDTSPQTPSNSPLSGGELRGDPSPDKGRLGGVIAAAAKALNQLRENWLNPPEWTDWVRASDTLADRPDCGRRRDAVAPAPVGSAAPCRDRTPEEEKAGYPARPVAKPGFENELKKRTLTNLYNARPAWLDNAHKTLDAAVANAYGWNDYTPDMPDEEILRRLLALNLAQQILS